MNPFRRVLLPVMAAILHALTGRFALARRPSLSLPSRAETSCALIRAC